jgi:hypothetical protein
MIAAFLDTLKDFVKFCTIPACEGIIKRINVGNYQSIAGTDCIFNIVFFGYESLHSNKARLSQQAARKVGNGTSSNSR